MAALPYPADLTSWRAAYPEFRGVSDGTCQAKLDEAALQVDPGVWGAKAGAGHGLLAAHLLASSPFGQNAKMSSVDAGTTYLANFKRMVLMVSSGFRSTR